MTEKMRKLASNGCLQQNKLNLCFSKSFFIRAKKTCGQQIWSRPGEGLGTLGRSIGSRSMANHRRLQGRIQDFGQGGAQWSFEPRGPWAQNLLKRGFSLKLPEDCMHLKKIFRARCGMKYPNWKNRNYSVFSHEISEWFPFFPGNYWNYSDFPQFRNFIQHRASRIR